MDLMTFKCNYQSFIAFCTHFKQNQHDRLIGFNGNSGFLLTFYKQLSLLRENEKSFFTQKMFYPVHMLINRKVWIFSIQRI